MIYREKNMDLFLVDNSYYFVHCISADFKLGAGIAKQFDKRFNMRNLLFEHYPNYLEEDWNYMGDCLFVYNTFNLVTKTYYYHKPVYASVGNSLILLRNYCEKVGIKKLAMPKIGCGLDMLRWETVSDMIKQVFESTDIEILVCIP